MLYSLLLAKRLLHWLVKGLLAGLCLAVLAIGIAAQAGWGTASWLTGLVWLLLTSLGWGVGIAYGVDQAEKALIAEQQPARRATLIWLGVGSVALTGLVTGLNRWLSRPLEESIPISQAATPSPAPPSPTPPPTAAGFLPVTGTRPEITPIKDFYRVDINILPPDQSDFSGKTDSLAERLLAQGGETELQTDSYTLVVDGLVETPLVLDMAALKAFPRVDQYATLACISNPVGGDLISTTLFQGARLKDVLERAGLKPEAVDVKFTGVDGYTESLPIETALDPRTLLCYAMGNQPLTEQHGAPLRLYTPNRFGMKNPKWIIMIEAVDEDYQGYWQQRGWTEDGWVQLTAVIDVVQEAGAGNVELGGIAFSGARGIEGVEVSVDGMRWHPAQLNRPLSPLTWVLWRVALELEAGSYDILVRAIDGSGVIQTGEKSATHPDGASGYHQKQVTVNG
jgi:DMSO/TMAO reductase YedYZ molybdopterin-dependent catalytic subunit